MNTAQLIKRSTVRERLDEIAPLIDFVPVAGPPIIFLAVPWLLFVLMLAGPFLLLVTLVAVALGAVALVALTGAILATPYLLVRRLREHRAARAASQSDGITVSFAYAP
jgi:hypothetical protein